MQFVIALLCFLYPVRNQSLILGRTSGKDSKCYYQKDFDNSFHFGVASFLTQLKKGGMNTHR